VTGAASVPPSRQIRFDAATQLFNQPGAHADAEVLDRVIALLTPTIMQLPARNSRRARGALLLANAQIVRFEATGDAGNLEQSV
jgi:hypothetical protein